MVLIDFSLTVKAATLMFLSGRGSAISSAKAPVTLSQFWATAELRLTPICQIGMHRHDS